LRWVALSARSALHRLPLAQPQLVPILAPPNPRLGQLTVKTFTFLLTRQICHDNASFQSSMIEPLSCLLFVSTVLTQTKSLAA
jgi:hypothetical protein